MSWKQSEIVLLVIEKLSLTAAYYLITKGRSRENFLLDRFFLNFYCGQIMKYLFQK